MMKGIMEKTWKVDGMMVRHNLLYVFQTWPVFLLNRIGGMFTMGRRGRMVVWISTTCAISAYHH